MARFKDAQTVIDAFTPHIPEGETIQHYAYGVKQPPIWLITLLFLLMILPGAIAVALLTKEYIVGLTGRRFVAIQFSSRKINVKAVLEYPLDQLQGKGLKTSKGSLFTHININDPAKPFVAKFHRMGMKENKLHAEAIADALDRAAA